MSTMSANRPRESRPALKRDREDAAIQKEQALNKQMKNDPRFRASMKQSRVGKK